MLVLGATALRLCNKTDSWFHAKTVIRVAGLRALCGVCSHSMKCAHSVRKVRALCGVCEKCPHCAKCARTVQSVLCSAHNEVCCAHSAYSRTMPNTRCDLFLTWLRFSDGFVKGGLSMDLLLFFIYLSCLLLDCCHYIVQCILVWL